MTTVNGAQPKSSPVIPGGLPPTKKPVSVAGPAPSTAPPDPPSSARVVTRTNSTGPQGSHQNAVQTNGTSKAKKKGEPTPQDPNTMYESIKNRINVLQEAVHAGEEEERRAADEARENIKDASDSVIQSKYIELFQEMKRIEREFSREKQKLVKEKDASKTQLSKANTAKTKLENLARELQKDNKKLRDDTKRLASNVEDAQEEILAMKEEMERRLEQVKKKERKTMESPEIVVKVVCKYRAELFFKISRKAKLSRLFTNWTDRMEQLSGGGSPSNQKNYNKSGKREPKPEHLPDGVESERARTQTQFVFCHLGRTLNADQTPEELDIESSDEIIAIEMMDLTVDPAEPYVPAAQRDKIKKNWTENPAESKAAIEDVFDGVVRERLKHILRQYELREKHFECVVRSKELEILVTRARADEQKQVTEDQNRLLRQQMEDMQNSQAKLMDKLIACCREPTGERTQRLFTFLREELEKRGTKLPPEASVDELVSDPSGE